MPKWTNRSVIALSGELDPITEITRRARDVVFLEEVYHAAFGGRTGRARIALNFEAAPSTDARIQNIRTEYAKTVYMYRPAKSLLGSDRPRLRNMVMPLLHLGFEPYDV